MAREMKKKEKQKKKLGTKNYLRRSFVSLYFHIVHIEACEHVLYLIIFTNQNSHIPSIVDFLHTIFFPFFLLLLLLVCLSFLLQSYIIISNLIYHRYQISSLITFAIVSGFVFFFFFPVFFFFFYFVVMFTFACVSVQSTVAEDFGPIPMDTAHTEKKDRKKRTTYLQWMSSSDFCCMSRLHFVD